MKKNLDWKEVGRVFSVLLLLFTVIRNTFTNMGIGLEIISWVTGEGKDVFIEQFLRPLGKVFIDNHNHRVILVDRQTIRVNLDAPLILPFDGAMVETNQGSGWVIVQKRGDCLYIDGRQVILHLSELQQNGKVIQGYNLKNEMTGLPVLHPNILDALFEFKHLIPDYWKQDENGNPISIYFWAVTFRRSIGDVCVRCLCWDVVAWRRSYSWFSNGWNDKDTVAVLVNN